MRCPFPGLLPFREEDAEFFFGRERETAELLRRLGQHRFLAVVGVSGSGKSSLVHAGLKPELRCADTSWRMVEIKPGEGPRAALASALQGELPGPAWGDLLSRDSYGLLDGVRLALKASPGENLLVIVDQFEELFEYRKRDAGEADLFVQQLLRAATEPDVPVYVLLTMRTDFLGQCALFRGLPEALNEGSYLVPRLTRREQEEVIRAPLEAAGVAVEPAVVDALLNAAEANRDELPVLQHLLKRLWELGAGRGLITLADLTVAGGWDEAITRDAEFVYMNLGPEEQRPAKLVFQRITEKGTGLRPIRTPCELGELVALTKLYRTALLRVLEDFRKRDLIVWESEERIDIPHECVTWRWSRLADWIEEEAKDARRLGFIDDSARMETPLAGEGLATARAWVTSGRLTSAWIRRYMSAEVAEAAVLWVLGSERRALEEAQRERDLKAAERSRAKEKRRSSRRMVLVSALVALGFAVLGVSFLWQKRAAEGRAKESLALQLAARSALVFGEDAAGVERATLLAIRSMLLDPSFDGDWVLRRELNLLPRTRWKSPIQQGFRSLAWSPDGRWLATGDGEGVRVWEGASGRERWQLAHQGLRHVVSPVAWSPDGNWVATGSEDDVRIVEASSGIERWRLAHQGPVSSVSWSPDGERVATGSWDKAVRVVEANSGRVAVSLPHGGAVLSVAWSARGDLVATGSSDNTARVISPKTRRQVALTHQGPVRSVAWSPDGKLVATGSDDKTARVMEASSGREVVQWLHEGPVTSVAWSPDGSLVATGSWDNTARLTEASTGKEVMRLAHGGTVRTVGWSSDGKWLATASDDGTARLMDVGNGREVARLAHDGLVRSVAWSPDGKSVATGSDDGTTWVMEAPNRKDAARILQGTDVTAAVWSLDGKCVATVSKDGMVRVMDSSTGKVLARVANRAAIQSVACSPDGKLVATGSDDKTARVIEASGGREVVRWLHEGPVSSVAWSPDGSLVATGSWDNTARLTEASSGKEVARLKHLDSVLSVMWSPNGQRIATGSSDNTARVMEASSGKEATRLVHQGAVTSVAWGPDGKLIATASADKTARVMEASSGAEVARLTHQNIVTTLTWSPDGKWVATRSSDVRVMNALTGEERTRVGIAASDVRFSGDGRFLEIWARDGNDLILTRHPLDPADLIREACGKVTRNLTVAEWRQYVGREIPYARSCDNLPYPPDYAGAK